MELGVDKHLVVVENQSRNIGEDHHSEDVGEEHPPHLVAADQPPHDDDHGQKSPQQRNEAHEDGPVVGHPQAAPCEDVQVGNRQEQEQQITPKKTATAFGGSPADEKIAQEDETDDELDNQVGARHVDVVAGDDLPRNGCQKHQACGDFDGAERIGKVGAGGIGKGHMFVIFMQWLQNQCHSHPR